MTSRFVWLVLVAVIMTVLPSATYAQSVQNQTNVFEINNIHRFLYPSVDPVEEVPAVDPNIAILQNYLSTKASPLAPFAEHILKHENWKLVLAISNGESTLCKRQKYNNCWGVGGAWNLRRYSDFGEGFSDVNRFLTEKYVAKGADTPQKIVNKYVGHPNANWVLAVNKVLTDLDKLPLVN